MCTFRRPSAFETLDSFKHLEGLEDFDVSVLVADNDETDKARIAFEKYAQEFPLPLRYVHAPAKNISIARNAALENAQSRWLAFIDDDEIATENWIQHLMAEREGHAAVIGKAQAVYGSELPLWAAKCDFHSSKIAADLANAYTGNALLDLDFVRENDLGFAIELGRTGGEDTLFFQQLSKAGGAMAYSPNAVVYEPVPPARATMKWVLRRQFRSGQTHGMVTKLLEPQAFGKLFWTATPKALVSILMAVLTIPGTTRSRRWLSRATLHFGVLAYCINPKLIEEYG
ncbi:glycosyltransferase [Erythrobacter sp. HA6-11]